MHIWLPADPADYGLDATPDGVTVDVYLPGEGLPTSRNEVEFVVLPLALGAPDDLLERLPSLRVVQAQSAGVENIVPVVRAGVTLCNASTVHAASTAEMTVALMLAAQRELTVVSQPEFRPHPSHVWPALADRTVLIVGYGAIGRAVEARLAGFECTVRRVARTARPAEGIGGPDDLPDELAEADVVVLCLPITPATRTFVDASFLAAMRDDALLVNVSRGAIVDTDALAAEVTAGRLRAALDVTDPEPLPLDHPLRTSAGALITPHVAGRSTALAPRLHRFVHDQVLRYVHGEPLVDVVTDGY